MYAPIGAGDLDRDVTESCDRFPSLAAPFDGCLLQGDTGLAFDSCEYPPNTNTITARQPPPPFFGKLNIAPGASQSTLWIETERANEEEITSYICQECNKLFKNYQELEQHTKRLLHKPWRCAEPLCGKTYARRDPFLRHRATHKDKSHACLSCALRKKQKTFKRKDHLKEHMRNCHSKDIEPASVENVRYACFQGEKGCTS
jgi:hypothetical protein